MIGEVGDRAVTTALLFSEQSCTVDRQIMQDRCLRRVHTEQRPTAGKSVGERRILRD